MAMSSEKQLQCLEKRAFCTFGNDPKKLGEGAFGCVFQATYTRNDQRTLVAVKLAKPRIPLRADPHAIIRNECIQLRRLSSIERPHPHIVTCVLAGVLHDPTTSCETTAMIMELCTEGCLADYQQQENYPISRLQIIYQICNGLAYMHHRGIYHRDLKPDNILIQRTRNEGTEPSYSYACKIADFGLATSNILTYDIAGTYPYLPPEVIAELLPYNTARADVFAVGVILYELLTGEIPWTSNTEKMDFVMEKRWLENTSPLFDKFFGQSLAANPRRRTIASELEQIAWGLSQRYSN